MPGVWVTVDQCRGSVSKVEMATPITLIYKVLFPSISTFETPPSRYVRPQVAQLDVTPPVSFAMHAQLIPSYYLDRIAQTRSVSDGEPLRDLAKRLRAPLVEPGGVLRALLRRDS